MKTRNTNITQLKSIISGFTHNVINEISKVKDDEFIRLQKQEIMHTAATAGSVLDIYSDISISTFDYFAIERLKKELGKINFWLKYFENEDYLTSGLTVNIQNDYKYIVQLLNTLNTETKKAIANSFSGEWLLDD